MHQTTLNLALLAGAGVLLVALGAVRLALRIGVPGLLLYLAIGIAIGEDGLGLHFDNVQTARDIGLIGLALILAEGGLTTRWEEIKPGAALAATLATWGVAVSVGVTTVIAHYAIDVDWRAAALIGAVVSATDAAAVFSTLRNLRLPRHLAGLLEAESALNDAPTAILVTVLAERNAGSIAHAAGTIVYQIVVGFGIGVVIGFVAATALRRIALPAVGLYPIGTLAFAIASYAAAAASGASGFLAVYVTGVWLGSTALPHRRSTLGFAEGVGWLAQIGLFVMLGLLVTPSRLGGAILPALAVGGGLLLVARPLSVLLSAVWFRIPLREQAFISWAGLRGAVPIVLTTIPLTTGVHGASRVFDTVFVLVVVFTLIQAPVLPPMVRRLKLAVPVSSRELSVEAAPLDELYADLLEVTVTAQSRIRGVEVWELRLPQGAAVVLVVREGRAFVPEPHTVLQVPDELLIVVTHEVRAATEQRLQAVSEGGRLARFTGRGLPAQDG
ncbi:MAG: potassium/proton antiporter [Actinomycetes bacterium]